MKKHSLSLIKTTYRRVAKLSIIKKAVSKFPALEEPFTYFVTYYLLNNEIDIKDIRDFLTPSSLNVIKRLFKQLNTEKSSFTESDVNLREIKIQATYRITSFKASMVYNLAEMFEDLGFGEVNVVAKDRITFDDMGYGPAYVEKSMKKLAKKLKIKKVKKQSFYEYFIDDLDPDDVIYIHFKGSRSSIDLKEFGVEHD